jgi:hypothetical protein
MPFHRAVVWVDHHDAQVLQFSADDVKAEAVHSHDHNTRQHGSAVLPSTMPSARSATRCPASGKRSRAQALRRARPHDGRLVAVSDFHRHMHDFGMCGQLRAHLCRRKRPVMRDDAERRGKRLLADAPDVKVRQPRVTCLSR